MIKLDFALIADSAHVDKSGKFHIDGEFRYINSSTVPAQHPKCAVVARWIADLVEVRDRENTIEVEIVDEDANPITPRSPQRPLNFSAIGPARMGKAHAQLVLNIEGLILPKYGDYSIHFIVNGTHNGNVRFHVLQADPKQ